MEKEFTGFKTQSNWAEKSISKLDTALSSLHEAINASTNNNSNNNNNNNSQIATQNIQLQQYHQQSQYAQSSTSSIENIRLVFMEQRHQSTE